MQNCIGHPMKNSNPSNQALENSNVENNRDPCYKVNHINIVNIVSEFGYQLSLAILSLLQY